MTKYTVIPEMETTTEKRIREAMLTTAEKRISELQSELAAIGTEGAGLARLRLDATEHFPWKHPLVFPSGYTPNATEATPIRTPVMRDLQWVLIADRYSGRYQDISRQPIMFVLHSNGLAGDCQPFLFR